MVFGALEDARGMDASPCILHVRTRPSSPPRTFVMHTLDSPYIGVKTWGEREREGELWTLPDSRQGILQVGIQYKLQKTRCDKYIRAYVCVCVLTMSR